MSDAATFYEIAALLTLAAGIGFVGILLRQPLIVSFIVVGLLAGPSGFDFVRASDQIELLSQLGIAVLLFLVGIKLDVQLIRSLGTVSLLTGLGQVAFTSLFGAFIALALGFGAVESLYIAVALTFSSTIIIVKLLSDKREIDSLHGQIALGFLIVQDLVVVLAMIALSAVGIGSAGDGGFGDVLFVLGFGLVLLGIVVLFVRYLADPLTHRLARSPELLICFAIALAAIFAAAADMAGLGKELGGLLAGVSLASTRYRETIAARLAPLRDFLLLFFFIALGSTLVLESLTTHLLAAFVFSLFVLIGNPLIVLAIMGLMGYRKRTGFLAGLTVAQISEFSLIFIGMGVDLGHVGRDALGLVTLVGLITIAASTYMITWSHQLYAVCEPLLGIFERRAMPREPVGGAVDQGRRFDILLFGLGRFGGAIALRLRRQGVRVLAIDFNPDVVRRGRAAGVAVEYGDASDPEFLSSLPLNGVRWAVTTVPVHAVGVTHQDSRAVIVQSLRAAGFRGRIAMTAYRPAEAEALAKVGAALVFDPFQDAADRAVELLRSEEKPERIQDLAEADPEAADQPAAGETTR